MPTNGSFWYGDYGWLYKRQGGGGGRRNPKYGMICNRPQYLYNKYTPGQNGVGAQSTAVRRAKNHRAVICNGTANRACGPFYNQLGMYNHYLYNPNGAYPLPLGVGVGPGGSFA